MANDNFGSVPKDIQPLLAGLLKDMRGILSEKEFLQPVWFMVDRGNERAMPIMAPFTNEADKRIVVHLVRTIVLEQQPHVDAVIFMCEGWRKIYKKGDPGFDDRTTPISARENPEDVIMILVETYDGLWIAEPTVKGEPGFDRVLGDIEFHYQQGYEGNMATYLPARNKNEVN